MTIIHTPWTAVIHIILTAVGFYFHRSVLSTKGVLGLHPFAVGPGAVGLVEPFVSYHPLDLYLHLAASCVA